MKNKMFINIDAKHLGIQQILLSQIKNVVFAEDVVSSQSVPLFAVYFLEKSI